MWCGSWERKILSRSTSTTYRNGQVSAILSTKLFAARRNRESFRRRLSAGRVQIWERSGGASGNIAATNWNKKVYSGPGSRPLRDFFEETNIFWRLKVSASERWLDRDFKWRCTAAILAGSERQHLEPQRDWTRIRRTCKMYDMRPRWHTYALWEKLLTTPKMGNRVGAMPFDASARCFTIIELERGLVEFSANRAGNAFWSEETAFSLAASQKAFWKLNRATSALL